MFNARASAAWLPKCSIASEVRMPPFLGTANGKSIGWPNGKGRILFGVPTPTLAERLVRIRREAGYGDPGKRAEFARKLGISPPSLHDLENGVSLELGPKSWKGYIKIGANPEFLRTGRGPAMLLKDIEKHLHAQTLLSMMTELNEHQQQAVEDIIKAFLRGNPGSSANDPFKEDPPKK